jgi:bleomycin hydrolase
MKNSWGTNGPYKGLEYLSFEQFRKTTVAVEMTNEAYYEKKSPKNLADRN